MRKALAQITALETGRGNGYMFGSFSDKDVRSYPRRPAPWAAQLHRSDQDIPGNSGKAHSGRDSATEATSRK